MIQRFLLLLYAVLLSSIAIAGDPKLRVTTLGYENAKKALDDRKQTILRSIETQISPGRSFSTSSRFGTEKMELRGSATHDKDSQLKVSLYYKHERIPVQGTSIQTTVSLKPGDSVTVGGGTSVSSNKNKDSKIFSGYRVVVALIDSDESKTAPPRDEPKSR